MIRGGQWLSLIFVHLKKSCMNLLTIIIVLLVAGIVLYLINKYVPMDAKIKTILNWVVVIILILWLLKAFGLFDALKSVNV